MATVTPDPAIIAVTTPGPAYLLAQSIRQRIMDRIALRLSRMTIANGYQTDCGTTVTYGRLEAAAPVALPSTNYWDALETNNPRYGQNLLTANFTVETFDFFEPGVDTLALTRGANKMLADVKQVMVKDHDTDGIELTFRGLARGLVYQTSDLITGMAPEFWVGVQSDWQIIYAEMLGNPFRVPEQED